MVFAFLMLLWLPPCPATGPPSPTAQQIRVLSDTLDALHEQVTASRAPQWGLWTLAALVILVPIVLAAWVLWLVERADSTPMRPPVSPVRVDPLEQAGIIERCPLYSPLPQLPMAKRPTKPAGNTPQPARPARRGKRRPRTRRKRKDDPPERTRRPTETVRLDDHARPGSARPFPQCVSQQPVKRFP